MATYRLSNIIYDTDGDDTLNLPEEIEVEALHEDEAVDKASDKTGWCIIGCNLQIIS